MALSTRVITTGLNTLAISSPSILQENAKPLETTSALGFGWSPSTRQATQHLKPCHRHELRAHKQLAATWTENSSRRRSKPNPNLMGNAKPRSLENSDNVVNNHRSFKTAAILCRSSTDFSKFIKWRPWPAFCAPASKVDGCYKVLQWNTIKQWRLTQVGPNNYISETNIAMYLQLLVMSGVPSGSSIPLQCAFFGTIAP